MTKRVYKKLHIDSSIQTILSGEKRLVVGIYTIEKVRLKEFYIELSDELQNIIRELEEK